MNYWIIFQNQLMYDSISALQRKASKRSINSSLFFFYKFISSSNSIIFWLVFYTLIPYLLQITGKGNTGAKCLTRKAGQICLIFALVKKFETKMWFFIPTLKCLVIFSWEWFNSLGLFLICIRVLKWFSSACIKLS